MFRRRWNAVTAAFVRGPMGGPAASIPKETELGEPAPGHAGVVGLPGRDQPHTAAARENLEVAERPGDVGAAVDAGR
jgi:hypothetical protein